VDSMQPMETCAFPTGEILNAPLRSQLAQKLLILVVATLLGLVTPGRAQEPSEPPSEDLIASVAGGTATPTLAAGSGAPDVSRCGEPTEAAAGISSSHTFSFAATRESCFRFVAAESEPFAEPLAIAPVVAPRQVQRFQWNPALKQSLNFMLLQHGFRIAMDHDARWMLLHKPFWHDYFASFKASEWGTQWDDGDSFLVNYVGHPLQGAISSNIYLQNDPSARALKFSNTRPYWNSRLKAMGWSAVYSILFESGPVLSETAIGNQGGYMYIPGCGYYPTCEKDPGRTYKPATNNTGWVDRVVTPTVGTAWLVLEDVIETKLVDRLAKGSSAKKFKILRAALAPSHSMANLLAGRLPWYRFPASGLAGSNLIAGAVSPRELPEWQTQPRFAVGMHFSESNLPMDREGCAKCRRYRPGIGFDFEYRLSRLLYFDSEYALFPGSGAFGEDGRAHKALFGLKAGRRFGSWGLFAQARPGLIHYEKSLVPKTQDRFESVTRFAFDLGGTAEYSASKRSLIRFRLGSTFVRYLQDYPDPNQPPVGVLSSDVIATQGNFYATTGYLLRF
jgi:hypothetical protein